MQKVLQEVGITQKDIQTRAPQKKTRKALSFPRKAGTKKNGET